MSNAQELPQEFAGAHDSRESAGKSHSGTGRDATRLQHGVPEMASWHALRVRASARAIACMCASPRSSERNHDKKSAENFALRAASWLSTSEAEDVRPNSRVCASC